MNCKMGGKLLFIGLFFVFGILSAGEGIRASAFAEPALPVRNLFPDGSFEGPGILSKFQNTDGSGKMIEVVNDAFNGKQALKFNGPFQKGQLIVTLPKQLFLPGGMYIVSVMGKPDEKARTNVYFGGLGAGLTIGAVDKKNNVSSFARTKHVAGEAVKWRKAVSKVITVPPDARVFQLWINLSYCGGTGILDDITVAEAWTNLTVKAESDAPIRQVIVTDDTGKAVFDSGILRDGKKEFSRTLKVLTPYLYTVRVIDGEGDVKTLVYPERKKGI